MIPKYLDEKCSIYQEDAVEFLNQLHQDSVQLIWTDPPIGSHDRETPHKNFSQMEAVELCAAVADAAFRVVTTDGVLVICLDNNSIDGVVPAIIKRTHWQVGGFDWDSSDLETTIITFNKGNPRMNTEYRPNVDVITSFIDTHTNPGDFVADPFCGSGVVLEAAVNAGRVALMNDINPVAVAFAIERYKEHCA